MGERVCYYKRNKYYKIKNITSEHIQLLVRSGMSEKSLPWEFRAESDFFRCFVLFLGIIIRIRWGSDHVFPCFLLLKDLIKVVLRISLLRLKTHLPNLKRRLMT